MYVKPTICEKVEASTTRLEKTPSSFRSKYEHPINDKIQTTESTSNMEVNFKNRSHVTEDQVYNSWWPRDIWNHLHDRNTSDKNDTHIKQNTYEPNYDYYYNYDELLPSFNESTLQEYQMLNAHSSYHLHKQLSDYLDNNQTDVDTIGSLFHNTPYNFTANLTTSWSLKEIINHYYNKGFSVTNNHTEDVSQSPYMFINPPWENFTSDEKLNLIKTAQGEPQRFNNATTIGLTTYYGILLSVGFAGNGFTILIILTNSYMRTAPNFFLLNIALADLVTCTMGK
jgi:hypothetical protein